MRLLLYCYRVNVDSYFHVFYIFERLQENFGCCMETAADGGLEEQFEFIPAAFIFCRIRAEYLNITGYFTGDIR